MRARAIAERRLGVDLLARAEPPHDVERRLEERRSRADRHAERVELLVAAADRALHDERSGRDRRERADLLGQQHRVPQRQQEQRARGPVVPLGEQAPHDRDVLVVGDGHVVVVADEQAVESGGARGPGPLDHPAGALANVHRWVRAAEGDADLHGAASLAR